MRDHITMIGSLTALAMVLGTSIWFVHSGMHEGTLLGVLITGGVAIGQGIAGIKPMQTIPQNGNGKSLEKPDEPVKQEEVA